MTNRTAQSRKANNKAFAPLAVTLIEHFEPLKEVLNSSVTHGANAADTGQEYPHRKDTGMRIILDGMCRSVYLQLLGEIRSSAGVRYDNIKDRMHKSQNDLFAHAERYRTCPEEMDMDPRTFTLAHWESVNTLKFEKVSELYDAMLALYENWTGEQWKFVDRNAAATANLDAEKKGAIRDDIMQRLARFRPVPENQPQQAAG